jgi:hypothetical protein
LVNDFNCVELRVPAQAGQALFTKHVAIQAGSFSRALPVMSGTRHSTSVILFSCSQSCITLVLELIFPPLFAAIIQG